MYALLNEPEIFKSYIAVDPSFWWDDLLVTKMAVSKLPSLKDEITLFISGREGPDLNGMKIDSMEVVLKQKAPANLKWKLLVYPDETHASIRLKSIYDRLKLTYAGLTSEIQFHPMNGIVLKDSAYKIFYFDDTTRLHYTTDGSIPATSSPVVKRELTLNGEATVTFKRFTNRGKYDKVTTGVFTVGKMLPPDRKQKNLQNGGLSYAYYEGEWKAWPDLKNEKPVMTGITDENFDIDKLPRKNNYALVLDGFLESKEEGYYIFFLEADKDSRLYLETNC